MVVEKTPKDRMIKNSPRTKGNKKEEIKKEEGAQIETSLVLTPEEKKEAAQVGEVIRTGKSGIDVFKNLSASQLALLKRTIAKGSTDDELMLFLQVCAGANLNPYLKQVHFVKRWDSKAGEEVGTIQTGIDGFRAIAESSGQYAGSDDAIFDDKENELEIDVWENGKKTGKKKVSVPSKATVTVYKLMGANRYPFVATARWSEYYPGDKQGYMWRKMPYGQLAKCAEALALRKAFPKLLSGFYVQEEMDQSKGQAPQVSDFEKAIMMISRANDIMGLEELKTKIGASEKYNDEQKKEIVKAVESRIKGLYELNRKNADTSATS